MPTSAAPPSTLLRSIPALDSLRTWTLRDARRDLVAGATVAAVALPQGIAYAMVAGLPVEVGLYTAIVMTAVGALFDSSKQLINGPTNAISIAVFSALAAIGPADERLQATVLFAFLIGAIQLAITLLRLGDLTRYISHSVIVGFTVGAAVLLVLDQLKNLLGMHAVGGIHDHFLVRFWQTMTGGGGIHPVSAAIGVGTIVATIALRALKQRVGLTLFPELLVVVVGAAALVGWLGLDHEGVRVVGDIPAKLPSLRVPSIDAVQVRRLAPSALAIATLGLLEAIAMAKAIAAQTRQKLDLNQQCLSEGLANLTGSFFQCMPGSGSLTRSTINQQAGAVTQWSGVFSAMFVALTIVLFAPAARYIPRSALAGILIVSSWRMVDRPALLYHLRATRFDAAIVAVTAISAVAVSIEFCVLIGVFLSILLTVPRAGRMLLTEFVVTPEGVIAEGAGDEPPCDRILIFGLEGEMFFGSSTAFEQHLETIEAKIGPSTRVIVLRVKRVRSPDAVCLTLLDDFVGRMQARGIHVLLGGVRADLADALRTTGITARLGPDHVFLEQEVRHSSTLAAVRHAYALVDEMCEHCPRRDQAAREQLYFMV